jgi:hypothetical protein
MAPTRFMPRWGMASVAPDEATTPGISWREELTIGRLGQGSDVWAKKLVEMSPAHVEAGGSTRSAMGRTSR